MLSVCAEVITVLPGTYQQFAMAEERSLGNYSPLKELKELIVVSLLRTGSKLPLSDLLLRLRLDAVSVGTESRCW